MKVVLFVLAAFCWLFGLPSLLLGSGVIAGVGFFVGGCVFFSAAGIIDAMEALARRQAAQRHAPDAVAQKLS